MKKVLSLMLSLIMIISTLSALPFTAKAETDSGMCGEHVEYVFDEETGTLSFYGYGDMYSFYDYEAPWSGYSNLIKRIIVYYGVTSIGEFAFNNTYPNIEFVNLADSVTKIERAAFKGCTGLRYFIVPNGVTTIGMGAFLGCTNMATVSIPMSVTSIGSTAFCNCTSLNYVAYPGTRSDWDNINIGAYDNEPLENAEKRFTVSMGWCGEEVYYAFSSTYGNMEISGTGAMYDYDESYESPMSYNSDVKTIEIFEGVTSIGDWAFNDCENLESITIPKSVTSIGDWALIGCTKLTDINYNGTDDEWDFVAIGAYNYIINAYKPQSSVMTGACGDSLTYSLNYLSGVLIIEGSGDMYDYTANSVPWLRYKGTVKKVYLTGDPKSVGANAFNGFSNLTDLYVHPSVTSIGSSAFINCTSLESFEMPRRTTYIAGSAFLGCTALKSVTLKEGLTSIENFTFKRCTSLTKITLPESVTSIGAYSFSGCEELNTVRIGKYVTGIGYAAFENCEGITDIYYSGSEANWNRINIDEENDALANATMHYAISGDDSGGEINITEPDFDAYNAVAAQAEELSENDYSAESYAALMAVLDEYDGLNEEIATQDEIDAAVSAILTAFTELVPYVNVKVTAVNGTATINSQSASTARLLKGESVTLGVTANDGFEFIGWYDSDSKRLLSESARYTFMVSSNISVFAKFRRTGTVSLTFESASGQVEKTVEKTAEGWAKVTTIESLLPDVPFSYGKTNGRWDYDNAEVLAALAAGDNVVITPAYDDAQADVPELPDAYETPAATLTYVLDAENNVASFLLAVTAPKGCFVEEIGTAYYYKKAADFNPTEYVLHINDKVITSKFTQTEDGVYVTNINKFTSKYNWAARGYITYRDSNGNVKTVYSNQINIVDRQQV